MRHVAVIGALLGLALVAACGEEPLERAFDEDTELGGDPPTGENDDSDEVVEDRDGVIDADVDVSLRVDEGAEPYEYGLRCGDDPSWRGDVPDALADIDPADACDGLDDRLRAAREALRAEVCTQEYGGPQTAEVSGELGADEVVLELHRRDGCGIGAWEALQPLLGPGEGGLGEVEA